MSSIDPNSLEGLFMSMVHSHNERALELRIMYRLLTEQGCEMPIQFQAPDATWEELERQGRVEGQFFRHHTGEGTGGDVAVPQEKVAERLDGPIRGSVTETLPSGIVVTTTALTDDGKVIVGERRNGERLAPKRDNGDVQDVEVNERSSLEQLRDQAAGLEPEPTIPADFSLAAATKITTTPILKNNFKQTFQDLLRQYVSTTVFADGQGNWEPANAYTDNALTAPAPVLINWPTGFYRSDAGNAIVVNISGKVVFVFGKNYQTRHIEATDACFVLMMDEENELVRLDEKTDDVRMAMYVPVLKKLLEGYFNQDRFGE